MMLRVVLQHKVRKLFDGKTPQTLRVNEFDKFLRRRDNSTEPPNGLWDSGCNFVF
jgi:hypothetical protein